MNRRELLRVTAGTGLALGAGMLRAQDGLRGRWRDEPALPLPLQEIYPALHRGGIHVAGGFTPGARSMRAADLHVRFEPALARWQRLAALPQPRHHPNLVGTEEGVLALGGFAFLSPAEAWAMRANTWIHDAERDVWRELTPAPQAHAETVCAALGDGVHVVGGRVPAGNSNGQWGDHVDSIRHFVYDASEDRWRNGAPAPTARNSAAAAIIDGLLYVVGGRTVQGGNLDVLEIYDVNEERWRNGAPMPQAQGGLAGASLGGRLFAFGGEYGGPAGSGVYAQVWCYEPPADRWERVADMPTPRHGLGAVSLSGRIYTVGGATIAGAAGTSAVVESFVV